MATQEQIQRTINESYNGHNLTDEELEQKRIEEEEIKKREAEFLSKKYDELKAKGEI